MLHWNQVPIYQYESNNVNNIPTKTSFLKFNKNIKKRFFTDKQMPAHKDDKYKCSECRVTRQYWQKGPKVFALQRHVLFSFSQIGSDWELAIVPADEQSHAATHAHIIASSSDITQLSTASSSAWSPWFSHSREFCRKKPKHSIKPNPLCRLPVTSTTSRDIPFSPNSITPTSPKLRGRHGKSA